MHLAQWTGDDRAEEVWSEIEKKLRLRGLADILQDDRYREGVAVVFIRHVLAAKGVAEADRPDYLKHAAEAESLARFLSGYHSGMNLILPPLPKRRDLVPDLENVARELRDIAKKSTPVSRKRPDRARTSFMRMISEEIRGMCGKQLDEVVAVLTDEAFPDKETSLDQVRSARKPTTKKGRSGRG